MAFVLSDRSIKILDGVHPDLQKVVQCAIRHSVIDFVVTEGLRTPEDDAKLFERGVSKYEHSRYVTGHAVSVNPYIDGAISLHWPDHRLVAKAMKECAEQCGVPLEWGGDWVRFRNGQQYQLPWEIYPAT